MVCTSKIRVVQVNVGLELFQLVNQVQKYLLALPCVRWFSPCFSSFPPQKLRIFIVMIFFLEIRALMGIVGVFLPQYFLRNILTIRQFDVRKKFIPHAYVHFSNFKARTHGATLIIFYYSNIACSKLRRVTWLSRNIDCLQYCAQSCVLAFIQVKQQIRI